MHGKGLKLGIYDDACARACAGFPGSLGKEELDQWGPFQPWQWAADMGDLWRITAA